MQKSASRSIQSAYAAAIAVTVLLSGIAAAEQIEWPLEVYEIMDDKRIVVFLNPADVDAAPRWSPGEGPPPVTIDRLINQIRTSGLLESDGTTLHIQEIKLKKLELEPEVQTWYYLVRLDGDSASDRGKKYVAMLLNGTIVPALVEPQSIK